MKYETISTALRYMVYLPLRIGVIPINIREVYAVGFAQWQPGCPRVGKGFREREEECNGWAIYEGNWHPYTEFVPF